MACNQAIDVFPNGGSGYKVGTPLAMQRLLNLHGLELVILPVMLDENGNGAGKLARA